jgi:hypothetical protein
MWQISKKQHIVNVSIYILKGDFNTYKLHIVSLMGNELKKS